MKLFKLLTLFCISAFFLASKAYAQPNAYINILTLNSGQVTLGGTVDIQVEVGNSGTANITASKVKTAITVPTALVSLLATGSQPTLPTGWSILSNTAAGVITLCNGTDVIAPGQLRTILVRIQGNTLGGPSTIVGQLSFSGGTNCGAPGSLSGNNTADDGSTSSIQVIAAAACAITATSTAGTIACNGGTTTITAASAGTSNSVEYSIGGAYQLSSTFTVPAGTYTVTAREVATPSCSATATALVIAQPAVVSGTTSTTNASSASSTNGTATVVAAGGTGAYSYSWNTTPVQTTATATGLAVGTYTVTISTANGCTGTATATVSAAACNIAATASAGTIACNGGTTTLTAVATGAIGAVEYSLNGGAFQTANTFTVSAGTYTITAREVANTSCSVNATAVVVSQPAALVATSTNTAILCNAGNSTVTVSATGGTAPYTGAGTFTRTAGAYTYTVTDANGCTSTTTGTITQPAAIAVSATFAPITTFGGTTTVTVSATGGTAPYVASSVGTFVRADGTFTFVVTDANGCTGTTTVVIAPFSTPVTADPAVGQMNFVTTANASQSANNLLFTQDYNLRIPFYNLSQSDFVPNGTIKVTIDLGKRLVLATGFNLATSPLNNYFAWTSAVVGGNVIITGTQIAQIPEDFASNLVFKVHGSLSCTSTVSTNISVVNLAALLIDEDLQNNAATIQYTLPVTVTTTQVNVTCNGAANGIINVIASPGTTVVIKNSANVTVTNTGLAPGVYTVTASATGDAPLSNTCTNSATVVIVQPVLLTAAASTTANNLCNGGADGVITTTSAGGTAPYSYTIAGPTVNTTGATSGIFSGLTAGTYTITSRDANLCTATTTAVVTQPVGTAPNISLGSDITSSFFLNSGISQTIVYNVAEIAGNPAVGDTIRITRVAGFTINLNTAIASTTVGSTTYTLDNARWKIDNTDPAFVSIILTNPSNLSGPGILLCNQRVNVAVTLTRNTTDISTFTLSARLRRANGELLLGNNLNSIVMTAE
jgi:SprB repeat